MKASETVISWERMRMIIHDKARQHQDSMFRIEAVCEVQAEITGKIMYEAGYDKALVQLADMTEECKQTGRQEVVKWIRDNARHHFMLGKGTEAIDSEEWQAQLKKWGIK